jgi:biopolymer transport protein ExbD
MEESRPDLTPLLDIIFIVMVFLMLTANVAVHTLNVDIPQTEDSAVLGKPDSAVLTIGIADSLTPWSIDGQAMSDWSSFTEALTAHQQQNSDQDIVIAADKNANVEAMLKVLAFLQQHNIPATQILMEESQ